MKRDTPKLKPTVYIAAVPELAATALAAPRVLEHVAVDLDRPHSTSLCGRNRPPRCFFRAS